MSDLLDFLRSQLNTVVDLHSDEPLSVGTLAAHLAHVLTERYAVLPLPTDHTDHAPIGCVPSRRWELPGDRGAITAYADGGILEGASGYWNTAQGDEPELFAAALVAAARYARGEGQ